MPDDVPTMKSLDSPVKENKEAKSDEAENCNQNATVEEKIDFSNVKIEPLFEEEVDFETFSKSDFRAVKVKECVAVPKSKKLLQFTLDDGTGVDRTILSGIHAYYEPEELVGKTLIAITNLPPRKMMGIESCGMLLSAVNNLKDSEDEELHLLMVDNHIPAGAKVTVTEVYSGAGYRLVSEPQQTAEISADEIVTVEFDNTYDHGLNPGYGVTNHFDYDEDEGWQWTQLPDNSVKKD